VKNSLQTSARIVLFLGLLSIVNSCKKENDPTPPGLETVNISGITQTGAVSGGNITDDSGSDITARGVCWGTASNPVVTGLHTTDGTGTGTFTSTITGLNAGTVYYVRAYATNSAGTAYGNELTFTTTSASLAELITTAVTLITTTTSVSGGDITDDNGSDITARGVCWSTDASPVVTGLHTTDGIGTGTFTSSISGLTAGTLYYVRAYATNSAGTAYGNQVTFTTVSVTGTIEISIEDMAFKPATITVAAGTTIRWTNKDGVSHSVTSDTGLFDSGLIGNGGTFTRQFNTTGTFPYHCTPHPAMTATVIVN